MVSALCVTRYGKPRSASASNANPNRGNESKRGNKWGNNSPVPGRSHRGVGIHADQPKSKTTRFLGSWMATAAPTDYWSVGLWLSLGQSQSAGPGGNGSLCPCIETTRFPGICRNPLRHPSHAVWPGCTPCTASLRLWPYRLQVGG